MREKRRLRRFDLSVPARVRVLGYTTPEPMHGRTRDLSAGGAFLFMPLPSPDVGSDVELEIDLNVNSRHGVIDLPMPREASVRGKGTVMRREDTGMAVMFERELQFA